MPKRDRITEALARKPNPFDFDPRMNPWPFAPGWMTPGQRTFAPMNPGFYPPDPTPHTEGWGSAIQGTGANQPYDFPHGQYGLGPFIRPRTQVGAWGSGPRSA